jgi:large subunit ribosomal protein L6
MSRIGSKTVTIPDKTTVNVAATSVAVKGPKGELTLPLPGAIVVTVDKGRITVGRSANDRRTRENHGTVRSRLANMVIGVTAGYQKVLELQGVGYRAQVQGNELSLSLGGIKPFVYKFATGLQVTVDNNTKVTVRGIDKELVGAAAAEIRSYYPPEPYKGKGIRYEHEHVRRKTGKTAAAAA